MFQIEEALDLGHYTMEARRAVAYAVQSAQRSNANTVTVEHLVVGLLHADVRASDYVRKLGHDPGVLQQRVTDMVRPAASKRVPAEFPMDDNVKVILRSAYAEAKADQRKLTSVDILMGVLNDGSPPAARLLTENGLTASAVRDAFNTDPDREKWAVE
jgi:ATP-dependent Clp protease ATP-binding subunit ClpC